MPRRSGIVTQPEHFIGLGEVLEDPEINPCNYNEAIQDKDATLWQKAMKTEMESIYSNHVWTIVEAPNGVKPIGCSGSTREREG